MEEKRLETIYSLLMDGMVLTHNLLIEKGLSQEDINILIQEKHIAPVKDNKYILVSVDKFRRYGVALLTKQKIKEANICFRKCYELAPNGKNICLQALLAAVKRYNYPEVFKIYANLETIQPEKNKKNNNLYLYLLSVVTECPQEYQEKLIDIEYSDLMLPNTAGNKIENEIRKAIYQNKYTYAYQLINENISQDVYSVKFELIKALLDQAIDHEKEHKSNLLDLAKKEKYSEILNILRTRQQLRRLGSLETYILLITDAINTIQKTNYIPTPTIKTSHSMYDALIGHNYELALEIDNQYIEYTKGRKETNIVNILLVKLNMLIQSIQQPTDTNQKEESQLIIETKENKVDDYQETIKYAEELAYYIKEHNIAIANAKKLFGILPDQLLLIKLIYARDHYLEKRYDLGDKLIEEVQKQNTKNSIVMLLQEEIKSIKKKEEQTNYTKKRI